MTYFSMFTGIGGFELGIQRAFDNRPNLWNGSENIRENSADTQKPQVRLECVGYSEIDKYAIATYEHNFKGHTNYGDATKIDETKLPAFDLLVGGFPCQAFSIAGKRRGFAETRGTLFFDIARILEHKRPGHLVLENVKGLLSHDSGKTFQTILGVLSDLGYRVEWQVLNSKDFGVPQNRERVYIVGHLRNGSCGQVFPIYGQNREATEPRQYVEQGTQAISTRHLDRNGSLTSYISPTVQASETPHILSVGNVNPSGRGMNGNVISSLGLSSTLSTNKGEGLKVLVKRSDRPKGYAPKLPYEVGNTIRLGGHKSLTQKHAWDLVEDKQTRIRRLTPVECERLQGFPDNWTIGSDTQRYKQCGNAVTVNVVQAVMERLYDH